MVWILFLLSQSFFSLDCKFSCVIERAKKWLVTCSASLRKSRYSDACAVRCFNHRVRWKKNRAWMFAHAHLFNDGLMKVCDTNTVIRLRKMAANFYYNFCNSSATYLDEWGDVNFMPMAHLCKKGKLKKFICSTLTRNLKKPYPIQKAPKPTVMVFTI